MHGEQGLRVNPRNDASPDMALCLSFVHRMTIALVPQVPGEGIVTGETGVAAGARPGISFGMFWSTLYVYPS